jgi:signal transduction histidine kinase
MNRITIKEVVVQGTIYISAIFFFAALSNPVFRFPLSTWNGWEILLFGWMGIFSGSIAWFGNLFLLAAWLGLAFGKKRSSEITSLVMSLLAVALALSTLQLKELIIDEGGGRTPIVGHGWGYYLWLASIVLTMLGSLVVVILSLRSSEREK